MDPAPQGYANIPQPLITGEPTVTTHRDDDLGGVIAVVNLGGLTIHVETVALARAVADAFTRAADLIQAAESGASS